MRRGERAATVGRKNERRFLDIYPLLSAHFLLGLFVHSFICEILNTYSGPGTVLCSGNVKINTTQPPPLWNVGPSTWADTHM